MPAVHAPPKKRPSIIQRGIPATRRIPAWHQTNRNTAGRRIEFRAKPEERMHLTPEQAELMRQREKFFRAQSKEKEREREADEALDRIKKLKEKAKIVIKQKRGEFEVEAKDYEELAENIEALQDEQLHPLERLPERLRDVCEKLDPKELHALILLLYEYYTKKNMATEQEISIEEHYKIKAHAQMLIDEAVRRYYRKI
ncbi:MAG: hypothetical protein AB1467_01780 [Candidatus Diapherotrites archaeon]